MVIVHVFYYLMKDLMESNNIDKYSPINCGDLRFGIQTNSHLKTMAKSLDKFASKL